MAVTPRNEQEVILSYDSESKTWHYYSDVPTLNKKWQAVVEPEFITVEDNGTISRLEGTVIGNVSISKKRTLSEEQKQAAAKRLAESRQSKSE